VRWPFWSTHWCSPPRPGLLAWRASLACAGTLPQSRPPATTVTFADAWHATVDLLRRLSEHGPILRSIFWRLGYPVPRLHEPTVGCPSARRSVWPREPRGQGERGLRADRARQCWGFLEVKAPSVRRSFHLGRHHTAERLRAALQPTLAAAGGAQPAARDVDGTISSSGPLASSYTLEAGPPSRCVGPPHRGRGAAISRFPPEPFWLKEPNWCFASSYGSHGLGSS